MTTLEMNREKMKNNSIEQNSKKNNPTKISNHDRVNTLIKEITRKNLQSVVIPLELIQYSGETQKAVFLARLLFLSDKGKKPNGFIWKSYTDWKKEIGLSQSQVERIVEDFQNKGIVEAKKMMAISKNNNASNTWHYRLNMKFFLKDLEKFLLVRPEENLGLEAEETSGSITETTNININKNITLYNKNIFQGESQNENENENQDDVKEKQNELSLTSNSTSFEPSEDQHSAAPDDDPDAEFLCEYFEPTLENKIWAVTSYPYKSPKQITERLIQYFNYEKGKNVKMIEYQWQLKWRNFVTNHRSYGAVKESFEDEHNEIKNELFNLIYDFIRYRSNPLVQKRLILENFCEVRKFDQKIIKEFLDIAVRQNIIAQYFESFYDTESYEDDSEKAEKVDEAMFKYMNDKEEGNPFTREVCQFVKSEIVVSEADIIKEFCNSNYEVDSNSLRNLLRVGTNNKIFTKIEDYYYRSFASIKNSKDSAENIDEQISKINAKLAQLGLESDFIES